MNDEWVRIRGKADEDELSGLPAGKMEKGLYVAFYTDKLRSGK